MKTFWIQILFSFFFFTFGCSNISSWVKYENIEFNYTVEFPENPTIETRDINSPAGMVPSQAVTAYEYSSPSRNNMFMVSCTKFPDTIIEKSDTLGLNNLFNSMIERIVNRFKGELLFEKNVRLGDLSVKEFRIEFSNEKLEGVNHITYRTFVKDDLQFILQTISEKGKNTQSSIDKFMNSFSFTE